MIKRLKPTTRLFLSWVAVYSVFQAFLLLLYALDGSLAVGAIVTAGLEAISIPIFYILARGLGKYLDEPKGEAVDISR